MEFRKLFFFEQYRIANDFETRCREFELGPWLPSKERLREFEHDKVKGMGLVDL